VERTTIGEDKAMNTNNLILLTRLWKAKNMDKMKKKKKTQHSATGSEDG